MPQFQHLIQSTDHSAIMNCNYHSYLPNDYAQSYYPPMEHPSPVAGTYAFSTPSPSCPFHSPYYYCTPSSTTTNTSPIPYPDYQQFSQLYSPPTQPQMIVPPPSDRTPLRRHRCFKKNELLVLHQSYRQDPHPSIDVLQQLAAQLTASVDKVRQWFKNRRHSDKQKKRETQPRPSAI